MDLFLDVAAIAEGNVHRIRTAKTPREALAQHQRSLSFIIHSEIQSTTIEHQTVVQRGNRSVRTLQHAQRLSRIQRQLAGTNLQRSPLRHAHITIYRRRIREHQATLQRRHIMHHTITRGEGLRAGAILHYIQAVRTIAQQRAVVGMICSTGIDDKCIER